jgi:hypothetical protein
MFPAARKPQIIIKTVPEAIYSLNAPINNASFIDSASLPVYEKENVQMMISCAKVLYDNARNQILDALSEIDSRITYWQYQKDHPWNYFVSKNPSKWVTGPTQEEEIEQNLDLLKSHQGELYVLLGQISSLGISFTEGYKNTFLTDYRKGYAWIDSLLEALIRLTTKTSTSDIPFVARAQQLKWKLERVHQFKNDLVADISETEVPSFITRNWLKTGALLFGLNYGYNTITPEHIQSSWKVMQQGFNTVVDPIITTIKDVLTPGWQRKTMLPTEKKDQSEEKKHDVLPPTGKKFFSEYTKEYEPKLEILKNNIIKMGDDYGLQDAAKNVLKNLDDKKFDPALKFMDTVHKSSLVGWNMNPVIRLIMPEIDYARGMALIKELEFIVGLPGIEEKFDAEQERYEKYLLQEKQKYEGKLEKYEKFLLEEKKKYEDQYAAIGKVVLLIPAFLAASGAYLAYQKLTAKNYAPLRRALVDINYLFIDPSKPLNDEQYGKMLYLVYMLKKRAEKELPVKKNTRADFIADLEKIESPELSVASKRAVIEDMFKKYSFLGLIQSK